MSNLEKAKEIIEKHLGEGGYGLYDERNTEGHPMHTLYAKNGLMIDVCYMFEYFEVFGLTADDFAELYDFYNSLLGNDKKKGEKEWRETV